MEEITKSVVRRYIKAVVFVICFFAVFFLVFSFGLLLSQQQTMEEPDYEIVISNRGEERQTPSSTPLIPVGGGWDAGCGALAACACAGDRRGAIRTGGGTADTEVT